MQRKLDRQTKLICETEKEYLQQSSCLRKTEEKWKEAESMLQIHQSLPGFRIYLCLCNCISTIMQIFSKIRSSIFRTLFLGVQVLLWLVYILPIKTSLATKEFVIRHNIINIQIIDNIKNECLEKGEERQNHVKRKFSRKKKYYRK